MEPMNRRTFMALPIASVLLPVANAMMLPEAEAEPAAAEYPVAEQIDLSTQVPAPGSFPDKWICGSPSCMDNQDPPAQVNWYNEHTAFLRQNKAYSY
jgi:hypothetical protein